MKTLIIAALMLVASVSAFSQANKPSQDTLKTKGQVTTAKKEIKADPGSATVLPAFPINETNAQKLLEIVGVFNSLLENQPGLPFSGKQIKEYQAYIGQYGQLIKEWSDKVAEAQKAKEPLKK